MTDVRSAISTRALGRAIGVAAGSTCAALAAVFILANPYRPMTLDEAGAWVVVVPGIGAAGVLAAIATLVDARRTLVVLFVVSFFPFSLYLLLTPGIFCWFGVAEMSYVAAGRPLEAEAQNVKAQRERRPVSVESQVRAFIEKFDARDRRRIRAAPWRRYPPRGSPFDRMMESLADIARVEHVDVYGEPGAFAAVRLARLLNG